MKNDPELANPDPEGQMPYVLFHTGFWLAAVWLLTLSLPKMSPANNHGMEQGLGAPPPTDNYKL